MRVSYFFRKPTASFYSIENLFDTVILNLKGTVARQVYLPFKTATTLALVKNCLYAKHHQSQINHITGDVYYVALALSGKKTILTIHDLDSLYSPNRAKNFFLQLLWLRLPVKKVKYVTVISEYTKKKLLEATRIAENKVVVIPNCVPFAQELYKPKFRINKDEPVLLQVGTKPNKNLESVIRAIEGLSCRLLILGKLSVHQRALLDNKHITYENYSQLSYEEVIALYYRADIVTFVSIYEGFGMPVLEANALGRPVITSNTTALPEVAGEGSLLVNPLNTTQIRIAIEQLVFDDTFRNSLVQAGFQNVQRYKPGYIAAQYEALYEKVLEEARR